jgi:hypothetical protein
MKFKVTRIVEQEIEVDLPFITPAEITGRERINLASLVEDILDSPAIGNELAWVVTGVNEISAEVVD